METINDNELLTAYILGELQADEQKTLEQELSVNPLLQEKIAFLQYLKATATEQEGIAALKQSIAQAPKNRQADEPLSISTSPSKPLILRWLRPLAAVAAVALLMIGVGYYFNQKTDGKSLYARFAMQPIEQTMGGITDTPKFNKGIAALNSKDLETARKLLSELAETSDSPAVLAPLARCYTALDDYAHAETVIGILDRQQYAESNWLHACLLLRKGDFNAASSLLKRVVADSKSMYQKQAAELLNEIS